MTIETIDDLITFIDKNFERLSDNDYVKLLTATIQVYVSSKPQSKETAINDILAHFKVIETFSNGQELPLFMNH